ncbi:MAG TPA: SpoIID/LytB domain-containing protein [Acidimicrobiia bacterium]|nr:SpoIID/LytB domain-containing protein [Acidimicrobiia bacterium]
MRLRRTIALFAASLTLMGIAAPVLAADEEWEFDGGGWGHGVGLSQFGALGQAQDGRNSTQILQHYYTGTSVASMPANHWTRGASGLWVGLVSNTHTVALTAVGGPLAICQPAAQCPPQPPYSSGFADVTINPGEAWVFERNPSNHNQCRFRKKDAGNTGWAACDGRITGLSPSTRVSVNGKQYARGVIRFVDSSAGFHVVVTVGLEQYLYGLAEVPSSWPTHALRAQAIIGRSYAVATAVERGGATGATKLSSCGCHLFSTTADQAYVGWSKENPTPSNFGAQWKAAVDDTSARVLTHPQSNYALDIAKAFYSSSNGGASEDVEFVWGGTALPWLRSVADKWSSDPSVNPLATWTVVVPAPRIEQAFGWSAVTKVEKISGPPGAVIRFTGVRGGSNVTREMWGDELRIFLIDNAYRRDGAEVRVSPYISGIGYRGQFLDIANNTFEAAIIWLAQQKITLGCNPPLNSNFCPDKEVTRGQMAVFISRALNLPGAGSDHFTDDDGKFYEAAANQLYETGITFGCRANRFCGDQPIPRGQMAAFLARAYSLPGAATDHFVDDSQSEFQGAINKIASAGITLGCNPPTNDRFCPSDRVTRGQMAAFLKRAAEWDS